MTESKPAFWRPSFNFKLGLAAMGAPVGYITLRHVNWKAKPDSKKRMLIHHGVFWSLCVVGLRLMHWSFKNVESPGRRASVIFGASALICAGFEAGGRLARWLIPKKAMPMVTGNRPVNPGATTGMANGTTNAWGADTFAVASGFSSSLPSTVATAGPSALGPRWAPTTTTTPGTLGGVGMTAPGLARPIQAHPQGGGWPPMPLFATS